MCSYSSTPISQAITILLPLVGFGVIAAEFLFA